MFLPKKVSWVYKKLTRNPKLGDAIPKDIKNLSSQIEL
jgi:hypothetical protein